jgi:hypothetical protein
MDILLAKKACLYIISHMYRPKAIQFAVELENLYYPPDTDSNDSYQIFNVTYEGGMHYVIEIPMQDYHKAEKLANNHGLKMVAGKPFNGIKEFPVNCSADACFVLEFI